ALVVLDPGGRGRGRGRGLRVSPHAQQGELHVVHGRGMRRLEVAGRWAVLVAVGLVGCKSASPTVIDVIVTVDATLDLDTVRVKASAQGKNDFQKDLPRAATVRISIQALGLGNGAGATIEATGIKSSNPKVIDRAKAVIAAGGRVTVNLH